MHVLEYQIHTVSRKKVRHPKYLATTIANLHDVYFNQYCIAL